MVSFYTFSVPRILWIFWKYINEIWLDKTSFQLFFIIKKLYVKLVKKNIEYGGKVSQEFYSLRIKTSGTPVRIRNLLKSLIQQQLNSEDLLTRGNKCKSKTF